MALLPKELKDKMLKYCHESSIEDGKRDALIGILSIADNPEDLMLAISYALEDIQINQGFFDEELKEIHNELKKNENRGS